VFLDGARMFSEKGVDGPARAPVLIVVVIIEHADAPGDRRGQNGA